MPHKQQQNENWPHIFRIPNWNSPLLQQPLKFLLGQFHQPIHLIFSALEVLDAEGIHRHLFDVEMLTPTQRLVWKEQRVTRTGTTYLMPRWKDMLESQRSLTSASLLKPSICPSWRSMFFFPPKSWSAGPGGRPLRGQLHRSRLTRFCFAFCSWVLWFGELKPRHSTEWCQMIPP